MQKATWVKLHPGLWLALGIGLTLKILLLATESVGFHSDEAILGLMARHILNGERPLFFYGQFYMGALDAYLIAISFLFFGQTVLAIRILHVILYAAVLMTTYALAWRMTRNRFAATASSLLIAIPPVLYSVYTTATLGDYQETLLLNNLIFLIVWDILDGRKQSGYWWLVAGVLGGLGWWSMALIVVSLGPLTLQGLWHFRRQLPLKKVPLLLLGFLIGAAPWFYTVIDEGPDQVLDAQSRAEERGDALDDTKLEGSNNQVTRAISLVLFNFPSLFGFKPPWSIDWIAPIIGLWVIVFYILVIWQAIRRGISRKESGYTGIALNSILVGAGLLIFAFVMFRSGADPTGRYILPLYPLLAILVGEWLGRVYQGLEIIPAKYGLYSAVGLLVLCLSYNLWGNVRSIRDNPPGLTTQFDPISHLPHDHDDELIEFLDSIEIDRGYTNYWVAYRFIFLTHERILLSPRLPYKKDVSFTIKDDRYPLYSERVAEAEKIVYITSKHQELDRQLRERFNLLRVDFEEKTIGPYTIFYNFPRHVAPEELAPFELQPDAE